MRDQCFASQQICVVHDHDEKCEGCSAGRYAKNADTCAAIPGDVMQHDFGAHQLGPGEEDSSLARAGRSKTKTSCGSTPSSSRPVVGITIRTGCSRPTISTRAPTVLWKCSERGYSELDAAVAGGVLFAQSTQATRQVQKFPDGVALRLPPTRNRRRRPSVQHLVGTRGHSLQLAIYALPATDVRIPLAPFRLSYLDLTIPPLAVSEFSSECDLAGAIQSGNPTLDIDLYYVLPHYHSLGHSFHLETFGGENDGKTIYDLGAFDGEAHGTAFDPPVSMAGAKGFRFSCGYQNPRSVQVGWGIGDQEMCVMLGFARSDYAFDASATNTVATTDKGTMREFAGTCGVLPLEFARGKGELSPMPGTQ